MSHSKVLKQLNNEVGNGWLCRLSCGAGLQVGVQ